MCASDTSTYHDPTVRGSRPKTAGRRPWKRRPAAAAPACSPVRIRRRRPEPGRAGPATRSRTRPAAEAHPETITGTAGRSARRTAPVASRPPGPPRCGHSCSRLTIRRVASAATAVAGSPRPTGIVTQPIRRAVRMSDGEPGSSEYLTRGPAGTVASGRLRLREPAALVREAESGSRSANGTVSDRSRIKRWLRRTLRLRVESSTTNKAEINVGRSAGAAATAVSSARRSSTGCAPGPASRGRTGGTSPAG